jgi:hypothetical protein
MEVLVREIVGKTVGEVGGRIADNGSIQRGDFAVAVEVDELNLTNRCGKTGRNFLTLLPDSVRN